MLFTLPISVKNRSPLGFWLTPVVADALARHLGEPGIICYGKLGLRTPTPLAEAEFQHKLDSLNVSSTRLGDSNVGAELQKYAEEICSAGKIESRAQDYYSCPCGCLELPVGISPYAKEKTFVRSADSFVCRVCNRPGELTRTTHSFLAMGRSSSERIGVYPNSYRKEINEIMRQIHDQGVPVSRTRDTGFRYAGINLDVEFVWSLMATFFSDQYQGERLRLVVTHHVLRQAVIALLLLHERHPEVATDLIVLPGIVHPGAASKWGIDGLVEAGFTGDLMRLMLVGSLGWHAKSAALYEGPVNVEHRRLTLFQKRLREVRVATNKSSDVRQALRNLCQQNIAQGLKYAYNPERFDYRTLTGLL